MAADLCTLDAQGQRRVGGGARVAQGRRLLRQQVPYRLRPQRPLDVVPRRTDNDADARVKAGAGPVYQLRDVVNAFEVMKHSVLIPAARAE